MTPVTCHDVRVLALEKALAAGADVNTLVPLAKEVEAFLARQPEAGLYTLADAAQAAATPTEAPAKPRGRPRKDASAVASSSASADATASSADGQAAAATQPDTVSAQKATESAAQAAAVRELTQTATAASPSEKAYTEQDVRNALVNLQTKLGSADKSKEILAKYSANKVISGVPKDKYATLIDECAKAAA